jgi:dTDP-4-dehydrorhamnose reductase
MLRLAGQGRALRVVNDQFGAPTWGRDIAGATMHLLSMMDTYTRATYHLTAKGKTTWYDFVRRIFDVRGVAASIAVIRTQEYPTAAARPRNSVLDCRKLARDFGSSIPGWEFGLGLVLAELR